MLNVAKAIMISWRQNVHCDCLAKFLLCLQPIRQSPVKYHREYLAWHMPSPIFFVEPFFKGSSVLGQLQLKKSLVEGQPQGERFKEGPEHLKFCRRLVARGSKAQISFKFSSLVPLCANCCLSDWKSLVHQEMIAVHENIYCTGEIALRKPGWVTAIAEVKIGLFVHRVQHVQDTPVPQPVCRSVASTCAAAALAAGSTGTQPNLCLSARFCSPASGCGKSAGFQAAVTLTVQMASWNPA